MFNCGGGIVQGWGRCQTFDGKSQNQGISPLPASRHAHWTCQPRRGLLGPFDEETHLIAYSVSNGDPGWPISRRNGGRSPPRHLQPIPPSGHIRSGHRIGLISSLTSPVTGCTSGVSPAELTSLPTANSIGMRIGGRFSVEPLQVQPLPSSRHERSGQRMGRVSLVTFPSMGWGCNSCSGMSGPAA